MLSRSGFELNETWAKQVRSLNEADRQGRELERRAQSSGAPSDHEAFKAHQLRTGDHEGYMAPHTHAYTKARDAYDEASREISRKGNWPELRKKREAAHAAYRKQHDNMHEQAKATGKPAGMFLPHNKEEATDRDHWSAVSRLHNGGGYSGSYHPTRPNRVYFFDHDKDRDAFHQVVKHHSGSNYEVRSRSRDKHGTFDGAPAHGRGAPHRVEVHEYENGRESDRLESEQRDRSKKT